MNKIKRVVFYVGNVFVGIISYYAYLFFWVTFSWGEQFRFLSVETFTILLLSTILYFGFNYLLLREEKGSKKYWWIALGVVILSIAVIVSIIEYS